MPTCHIAIRGDLSRLVLTNRPDELAVDTQASDGLLPWRSVRDFDAQVLPAGAEFLQIATKVIALDDCKTHDRRVHVVDITNELANPLRINALTLESGELRVETIKSQATDSTECFEDLKFCSVAITHQMHGLEMSINASDQDSLRTLHDQLNAKKNKLKKIRISIGYDYTTDAALSACTSLVFGSPAMSNAESKVPPDWSLSRKEGTDLESDSPIPIRLLFKLNEGQQHIDLPSAVFLLNTIDSALTVAFEGVAEDKKLRPTKDGIKEPAGLSVDVSATKSPSKMCYAFWSVSKCQEIERDRKTTAKKLRLKDAFGYIDSNFSYGLFDRKLPHIDATVSHMKYVRSSLERKDKDSSVLMFNDLGFDGGYITNTAEWFEDLRLLSKTQGSHEAINDNDGVRLVVGIIGRKIPSFAVASIHEALFVNAIQCWWNRSRGKNAPFEAGSAKSDVQSPSDAPQIKLENIEWKGDSLTADVGGQVIKAMLGSRDIEVTPKNSKDYHASEVLKLRFSLDELKLDKGHGLTIWDSLYCFFRRETVVVLSAHTIRAHGYRVSHRLSWEQTAQDCVNTFQLPELRRLGSFAHIVVRCGITGAVHMYQAGNKGDRFRNLHYDPIGRHWKEESHAYFRDVDKHGRVIGANTLFAAEIVGEWLKHIDMKNAVPAGPLFAHLVGQSLARAISRTQRHFISGYGDSLADASSFNMVASTDEVPFPNYDLSKRLNLKDADPSKSETDHKRQHQIACIPIQQSSRWKILDDFSFEEVYCIACRIVANGLDQAFNFIDSNAPKDPYGFRGFHSRHWPKLSTPVVRFGHFVTVDREEIEALRTVHSLMSHYCSDSEHKRPLNIGVFGPPGSGKSFGVQCVAQSLFSGTDQKKFVAHNLNVAQMEKPEDLARALIQVTGNAGNSEDEPPPLVFLDEFDSKLGDENLGWLRVFLALMEDGQFKYGGQNLKLNKAMLIFAGGTRFTFDDFARNSDSITEEERAAFVNAKGPDFVSRLAGHINLLGLNPRDSDDRGYMLRRAILLRNQLESRKLVNSSDVAKIAPAFLEALLRIPLYRHGARSLRIVLDTCLGPDGQMRTPSQSQLNMHLDANQLFELYQASLKKPTIKMHPEKGLNVEFLM